MAHKLDLRPAAPSPADRIFFTGNNIVPTVAPSDEIDSHLLLNGDLWSWDGASWRLVNGTEWVFENSTDDANGDKISNITRPGGVGIGGALSRIFGLVVGSTQVNKFLSLATTITGRGQIIYGNEPLSYMTQRVLPTAINGWVDLGQFGAVYTAPGTLAVPNSPVAVRITMTTYETTGTNSYVWFLNPGNNHTGNVWTICPPSFGTGPYVSDVGAGIQDFELNYKTGPYGSGPAHYTDVRVRRKQGTSSMVGSFRIEGMGAGTNTFRESALTGTDAVALVSRGFEYGQQVTKTRGTYTTPLTGAIVPNIEDSLLICAPGSLVQLPNALLFPGREITVKKASIGGTVTVTTNGGLADGLASATLPNSKQALTFQSDGTGWVII
jgi:hypothetical protein